MNDFINWLLVVLGVNIPQGQYSIWYNFWSGFGNIFERILELSFIGYLLFHRHNCHVRTCLRMGKYSLEGTPYMLCKKHHPEVPQEVTIEHVKDVYESATKKPT
jgi:hypothetical protein